MFMIGINSIYIWCEEFEFYANILSLIVLTFYLKSQIKYAVNLCYPERAYAEQLSIMIKFILPYPKTENSRESSGQEQRECTEGDITGLSLMILPKQVGIQERSHEGRGAL